jgi:hypothetical protein
VISRPGGHAPTSFELTELPPPQAVMTKMMAITTTNHGAAHDLRVAGGANQAMPRLIAELLYRVARLSPGPVFLNDP